MMKKRHPWLNSHSTPATMKWLHYHYEAAVGVCIPRYSIYKEYVEFCRENFMEPVNSASFGKIIRKQFPNLTTRRLGTRGQSKYHYYGLSVKANKESHSRSNYGIEDANNCGSSEQPDFLKCTQFQSMTLSVCPLPSTCQEPCQPQQNLDMMKNPFKQNEDNIIDEYGQNKGEYEDSEECHIFPKIEQQEAEEMESNFPMSHFSTNSQMRCDTVESHDRDRDYYSNRYPQFLTGGNNEHNSTGGGSGWELLEESKAIYDPISIPKTQYENDQRCNELQSFVSSSYGYFTATYDEVSSNFSCGN